MNTFKSFILWQYFIGMRSMAGKGNGSNLSSILSLILLIGCVTYVIYKGQECIQKYLDKPERMDSSYKPISDLPFPSVTFCAEENPAPYDENALKKCQRSKVDYTIG